MNDKEIKELAKRLSSTTIFSPECVEELIQQIKVYNPSGKTIRILLDFANRFNVLPRLIGIVYLGIKDNE